MKNAFLQRSAQSLHRKLWSGQGRFCFRCDGRTLQKPVLELERAFGRGSTRWLCWWCVTREETKNEILALIG